MQVMYVCGVYARKYIIGLKLYACVATVLTVETGKRTTGLLSQLTSRYAYTSDRCARRVARGGG